MVKRSCIILWALTILFLCRAFGFPLPYELTVRSEGDLIRYYEEGYFEGIALEELLSLYRDKVNLNTATLSELESIPYMSKKEAGRIREFCRKQVLFSLNQLLTEKLVSSRTFQLIHPFVRTGWIHKVNGDMRTEADQKGVSSRVSLSVGPLEGDMRVDYRDRAEFIPGEEYRLKRVDAVVIPEDWFVSWKRGRFFLITGSFKAHFAQGLAVCGGSLRSPGGLRGETGMQEYFKGAAMEYSRGSFRGRLFYSRYKKGDRIPLFNEEENEYEYFDCDDVIPTGSIGGEAFWRSGAVGVSLIGLYHDRQGEVFRLGGAGWTYEGDSLSLEGEAVSDGESGAWQVSLSHGGGEVEGQALFFENRGVCLPLTDSLREKLESYWEGTVRKIFPRGKVAFSVRSYNGKSEEDDNLKYRVAADWAPWPGISLEVQHYHYQENLYYTSLELGMKKGRWRPSVEYLLYYSRAQKIYLGIDYDGHPFRMSLDLRYGGAYGWDKIAVVSGSYHLGRHIFISARYRYDRTSSEETNRWSVYLRTSL